MNWSNITSKAAIGVQLGSLAASVFLHGHDEAKNEEISNKLVNIAQLIALLTAKNSQQ